MTQSRTTPIAQAAGSDEVMGPTGTPLTRADLPPVNTRRWVMRRKAEVVAAVRAGLISLDEACEMYHLSIDEFLSWQRQFSEHGLNGLRATRKRGKPGSRNRATRRKA